MRLDQTRGSIGRRHTGPTKSYADAGFTVTAAAAARDRLQDLVPF